MRLFVARHGETDFNVQGRYAGSTDVPLNETGIAQAKALAEKLSGMGFDAIISSPLLRAKQTAEIVSLALNQPYIVSEQFKERSAGVYEGLTRDEVQQKYPELWRQGSTRSLDFAPDGGETIRMFDERIAKGIEILSAEYSGKRILLVCHAFASRVINRQCMNLSFDDMHGFVLGNCEIVEYAVVPSFVSTFIH